MRPHSPTHPGFELPVLRQFPPTRKYLVGVSGGRDSIVLLDCLVNLGYRNLVVCHLDHQLRGRQSRADSRFVQTLAQSHGLKFESRSENVRRLAANSKASIETAGRDARYRFFAETARGARCRTIFLGHHADDLVETFVINLFRGAGTSGLTGMRTESIRRIGRLELMVVRPLLGVWRNEIDQHIKARRLKFREDPTNRSLGPLRNRVRHKIIPFLEREFGRPIRKNLWRAATIASEEEAFFEELLPKDVTGLRDLAVEPLRTMPVAMQRQILHRWLRKGDVSDVGFDLVERVRQLLDLSNRVAKTNLPGRLHVRRQAGRLFVEGLKRQRRDPDFFDHQ